MRIGVPPISENCFDAAGFLLFASEAGVMRVPNPAAGMITTTFIAGCKYKARGAQVQISLTQTPCHPERSGLLREAKQSRSRRTPNKLHTLAVLTTLSA